MKKLVILLTALSLFANNVTIIKNLIGEKKYKTYYRLLKPVINDKNQSLEKTLEYLQNNGLLDIFFDKPKTINPTFVFLNNNPVFNTKTLYKSLDAMGYYFFYPVEVKKNSKYSLTLEMKSTHYIDPLLFLKTIKPYGCNIVNIEKNSNYTYTLDCSNEHLDTLQVIDEPVKTLNAKGVYWINPAPYRKVSIQSSIHDKWYPYIVFFDENLNILNIIAKSNHQQNITLNIPPECRYIKITDNYSKKNFKRGITIKGIK